MFLLNCEGRRESIHKMNLLYLLHYAKTKMVLKKTCIQRVGVIEGKITDTVFYGMWFRGCDGCPILISTPLNSSYRRRLLRRLLRFECRPPVKSFSVSFLNPKS